MAQRGKPQLKASLPTQRSGVSRGRWGKSKTNHGDTEPRRKSYPDKTCRISNGSVKIKSKADDRRTRRKREVTKKVNLKMIGHKIIAKREKNRP